MQIGGFVTVTNAGQEQAGATRVHARLNGVSGDAAAAVRWYRYARELGAANDEAAKRPKEMNQLFEQFLALRSRQKR